MIKATIDNFKQLRIYRRLTLPLLFNDMLCNRIMKLNSFVNYAPKMYQLSCNFFGKNFINTLLHSTYCKVFTAGNTIQEANEISAFFRTQGIDWHIKVSQSFWITAQRVTFITQTCKAIYKKMQHFSQRVQDSQGSNKTRWYLSRSQGCSTCVYSKNGTSQCNYAMHSVKKIEMWMEIWLLAD